MGQQQKLGKGPSGTDRHIFEETGRKKKSIDKQYLMYLFKKYLLQSSTLSLKLAYIHLLQRKFKVTQKRDVTKSVFGIFFFKLLYTTECQSFTSFQHYRKYFKSLTVSQQDY